jgi:hypothetical protein
MDPLAAAYSSTLLILHGVVLVYVTDRSSILNRARIGDLAVALNR